MKKIAIFVNHSFPHVGGCETVIKAIAEKLVSKYQFIVDVYAESNNSIGYPQIEAKDITENGVNYLPTTRIAELGVVDFLNNNDYDHLFVYSDMNFSWPTILKFSEKIKATKSIVPLGMYKMAYNTPMLKEFLGKKDQFSVIMHSSSYTDAKHCDKHGIPYQVIPNGIDLNEMKPTYLLKNSRKNMA